MARLSPPSIRTLSAAAMVLPVFAAAAALLVLSGAASLRIAEQLGVTLVTNATDRVRAEVRSFLAHAVRVSDLYAQRLADGTLDVDDLPPWERTELQDLLNNPTIASICFGGLAPGSVVVIGTDGIWEAVNARKEFFGKDRLFEIIGAHAGGIGRGNHRRDRRGVAPVRRGRPRA